MSNPLARLKQLPWRSLFLVATLTAVVVTLLELIIGFSAQIPGVKPVLITLLSGPLGFFTTLLIAFGVGVLAVYILERMERTVINTSSLWGLLLCLAIVFLLRSFLPIPVELFQLSYISFVSMMVGLFWKSRPYWRGFRRW
jgi:putative Mn2+ efflux pump MntP